LLESVLLNVIRGTGLAGLGAMTWQSQLFGVTVCRPLLDQNRRDCEALCRSIGWHWFDDPLNSVLAQKRNRIRADILPTLFELSPDLDRRIHRLSDQAQAAHDLIARLANQSAGCAPASSYERDQFTKLDRLVLGATLRAIGIAHGVSPDLLTLNVLDPLMGAIQSNDRKRREFAWPGGIRMILEADQLLVRHEDDGCDERMMSSE
jgi:hypothetical protein